jgi:hypothetical protein
MNKLLLLLFVSVSVSGATTVVAQDGTNATLTQCRDLAEAGNFIGPEEVLANGKVCKVQKTTIATPQVPAHVDQPNSSAISPSVKSQTQVEIGSQSVDRSSQKRDQDEANQKTPISTTSHVTSSNMQSEPTVNEKHKRTSKENGAVATTITFVTIQNGSVAHLMPEWAIKWVRKNAKKYPDVRFQTAGDPIPGARNFVIAFSASASAVQGFQPVTHTDTSTNTSPVFGSGTVTDSQGGMWNYTYNGTITTTTTTTTQEQVPYVRNSSTLYATAFNEQGEMVAQRWHVYSTQSGGDGANALGYNLGNALAAINARGHMLKTIVEDVARKRR